MHEKETLVSICCLAYNHEPYIRKCLDGFLMQKTNFKYEILIHDDASTDNTAQIIKDYENKYPDIVKPIYQTENQYSKGVSISKTYQYPRAQGKYIALCEGDDFWTDPLKLQTQFDFLENNPDFSICVHQVLHHNCETGENNNFTAQDENKVYTLEEIVMRDCFFATNSIMMVKEVATNRPKCFDAKGFGDFQVFMYAAMIGKFYYMSKCMSVYNYLTLSSWSRRFEASKSNRINNNKELIKLLKRVNEYYDFKYDSFFSIAIENAEYELCIGQGNIVEIHKPNFRRCYLEDLNQGRNPNKRCIINRFPRLFRIYLWVKERVINGKK